MKYVIYFSLLLRKFVKNNKNVTLSFFAPIDRFRYTGRDRVKRINKYKVSGEKGR